MSPTAEQIKQDALGLPVDDREAIAEALFASLLDAEIAEAWNEEAERRYQEIRSGSAKTIPAAEALAQLRERLGL